MRHLRPYPPDRRPCASGAGSELFGPFVVHEQLAERGMARVHRATRRLADGREIEVRLERLHGHMTGNPRAVAEFLEDARLASLMDHRNICRFYGSGRLGGEPFIVMEHEQGRTLDTLLLEARVTKRPIPLAVALSLLCQLCDALEYADERVAEDIGASPELAHRDLSPANILVTRRGRLKLLDVAFTKAPDRYLRNEMGIIEGRFGYLAPELLVGGSVDRRADVFALGVVAWELIVGDRLFTGTSDVAVMERIRLGSIDAPSTFRHSCPPRLDVVVMQALAPRPGNRWRSASAMGKALRALAAAMHAPVSPAVVEEWLSAPASVPLPITAEHSDAITQIRHMAPRSMPRLPFRFARGTAQLLHEEAAAVAEADIPTPEVTLDDRVPPRAGVHEWRYRALAMLGGGLLTTAVIVALFVTRSLEDAGALPLRIAVGGTYVSSNSAPLPERAKVDRPLDSSRARAAKVRVERLRSGKEGPAPRATNRAGRARYLSVRASDVKRLSGKYPRSRGSRARYRARICIDEKGEVSSVKLVAGPKRLRRRIVRTLRGWRYRPYRRNGAPVRVCFYVRHRLLHRG